MRPSQLEAMLREHGADLDLDTPDLHALGRELAPLLGLADQAPEPSAQLARLLAGHPHRSLARRARRPGAVASAVVLAISTVGATGLSAAANTLPAPLQRHVSDFSRQYLPWDAPAPLHPWGTSAPDLPLAPPTLLLPRRPGPASASADGGDAPGVDAALRPAAPAPRRAGPRPGPLRGRPAGPAVLAAPPILAQSGPGPARRAGPRPAPPTAPPTAPRTAPRTLPPRRRVR